MKLKPWIHQRLRSLYTHRFTPRFDLREWVIIIAMAVWIWLNVFDLLITYEGLASGRAYEANRFMAGLMHQPWLAVSIKILLAYGLLTVIARLERRWPFSGLTPLLAANIWLSYVCLHNLYIVNGREDWTRLLLFYPLAEPPQ